MRLGKSCREVLVFKKSADLLSVCDNSIGRQAVCNAIVHPYCPKLATLNCTSSVCH